MGDRYNLTGMIERGGGNILLDGFERIFVRTFCRVARGWSSDGRHGALDRKPLIAEGPKVKKGMEELEPSRPPPSHHTA
jgi:hypothetical protein